MPVDMKNKLKRFFIDQMIIVTYKQQGIYRWARREPILFGINMNGPLTLKMTWNIDAEMQDIVGYDKQKEIECLVATFFGRLNIKYIITKAEEESFANQLGGGGSRMVVRITLPQFKNLSELYALCVLHDWL